MGEDMAYSVIDTYDDFRACLNSISGKDVKSIHEAWEAYMSKYPELLKLQLESYEGLGVDWRSLAEERVFPKLPDLLPLMEEAYHNLEAVIPRAYGRLRAFWGLDPDVLFVIYVGIGCGAGWATEYAGHYAVLLGLESIAELGWHDPGSLEGLVLHELSHIVHMYLRGETPREFEEAEKDPLFLLYSEGFAMRCEHLMLGEERWRIASHSSWLELCRKNAPLLAAEYLRRVREGLPVNDFYGSWLSVQGISQVGYYLGHEVVRLLERELSLRELATLGLDEIKARVREVLKHIAEGKAKA